MRAATDFESVLHRGLKSGRATVVVYAMLTAGTTPRVGFAVSKAVGGAVARNQVRRRLRAIVGATLSTLPAGAAIVVRALPAASVASFGRLEADVTGGLEASLAKASIAGGAP